MAGLISVSINVADLPKEKFVVGKKGTYYNFTISVNDDTNQFGQNVSLFDSQTKEEREAKKSKTYIGNGKVVWTDGQMTTVVREDAPAAQAAPAPAADSGDLPF
tara:strand:+ start:1791 stop:2102 length:312 start_codon:yes stop_codon:yes gene_type:complete